MAQDTQHTPGPWQVFKAQESATMSVNDSTDNHHRPIVHWLGFDDNGDMKWAEKLANAKLIVSAPTLAADNERLREVLKEFVDALEARWGGEPPRRRENAVSPRMEDALVAARAAIAKATEGTG